MVKASASASAVTTASIRASLAAGVAAYLKLPPGVTVNTAVTGKLSTNVYLIEPEG